MQEQSPIIERTSFGIRCNQVWEDMPDHEKGKFCNACSKPVIDFTDRSRDEIISYLRSYPKTCGMFYTEDVDNAVIRINSASIRKPVLIFGLIAFLGFRNQVVAQPVPVNTSISPGDSNTKKQGLSSIQKSDSSGYPDKNGCPVKKVEIKEEKKQKKTKYRKFYLSKRFPFIFKRRSRRTLGAFDF